MTSRQSNHAERMLSILQPDHFAQVKELMQIGLSRAPSDDDVKGFLTRHRDLLGMIVSYDEVETEARSLVWQYCRSDFPTEAQEEREWT